MKLKLCVRLLLWFSALLIFSSSSKAQPENDSANPIKSATCSFECEEIKALQNDNQELKKLFEKLGENFLLLQQEVHELKNLDISWAMEPLRGPPGEKGEIGHEGGKGDTGQKGGNGDRGSIGPKGEKGQVGPQGPPAPKGEKGEKGGPGPFGSIGDRGITGPQGQRGPDGPKGSQGPIDPHSITSCSAAMTLLPFSPRRLSIYPQGNTNRKRVEVLCDFETDGGGWTVIQKRSSGPKEQFKQNWNEYVKGFGSLDGNFWLGLENIRALTKNGDQELRIELEDFDGNKKYAKYSSFSISDASDFYRLTIGGFSGDSFAGDSFTGFHNGQRFSTIDKDNDNHSSRNCVDLRGGGGWWFPHNCGNSNLNGRYFEKGETVPGDQGILWFTWKGAYYSLAKSEMKIRTKKP